ncbi:hybrid sensor histidine kinase/response regulator transcription factor [Mucilaginibacter sp. SP1R1]|uniref:hybrid sensor histidine kinase/response regulator transcription factor n=1 Tax=Mucilaginibacter sp. SP1R1 TaxID=2723091 RepID=UPI001613832F|nr:two-component regulator propeller domain-containing protein [Mucilaginibacter sp. SP1R1]MBB6149869.1 ligand-binding sensor domain-containing protein/signal transduction histidine kinase/DNA-binding response OmpR family regulator [Mucilaginibacter sp. SP1R1]
MRPIYLAYLLFLLPFNICNAQSYYFRHYQVENGLSNNTVYCTLQDKHGFLWFGTKDGLNRFDGYTFKVFRHNPKDKNSIMSNMVHTLNLDKDGSFWVGTDQGLDKYNPQTESFVHITSNNNAIRYMVTDQFYNCWFVSRSSLMKYDKITGKITDYRSYQHFEATSVAINNGDIWVSSTEGTLNKLDTATRSFTGYSVFKNSKWAASNFIEKIFSAGNNKIFVGTTSRGLKVFDCTNGTYVDLLTYNANKTEIYVRDFVKYADNEFWIATESGVFIYDSQKGTFLNLKKQFNDPYSISDNAVYTLYKDSEGGIWAGTYFGGINYYPKQYSTFNKFYPASDKAGLQGNVVREICKDMYGNLWMGTEDNGLNKLSADKQSWTHYYPGVKNGISNTNIHGLLASGNELFVGTFERGLDILDIPTGKVIRYYVAGKAKNMLKSNFIICFCKTRSGIILIGTTQGMYRYNTDTQDFTIIDKVPPFDFVYCISEDHNGKIWVGTVHGGIHCYDPVNNTGVKLHDAHGVTNALGSTTVNGIFEDSNHQLWFATEGLGLWNYNPETKAFKFHDLSNGFPSNYVFRILEDDNKNIWVSTTRGLVCLNITNNNIKIYTKASGLLSDQFNYNSAFKDTDGTMYFGCVKGMVSFNPTQFKKNDFVAPVYITGFQVHNQEISVNGSDSLLHKSIIFSKHINLNHNQSSFSIDFAALSYPSPEMTQYKYMMKGLDKGWTYLKTNRKAYFTQLLPGHYTFIVKAANNNGLWSAKETVLYIDISPPFWESVWAYIIYTLLILLAIYYLLSQYHIKTRDKNKRLFEILESDKEKQIYNAKIEFFTNIAHEIRTPLTLIKGPMEKVIKNAGSVPDIQNNLKIMEKNTNRLLDLTNQLLDFRKTETNGFTLSFVKTDITELLADTFERFKPMAEQTNMHYELIHPDKNLYAFVDIEAFTKIISNLINNAIKYGKSVVEVELLPQDNDSTFSIEVRNNGYLVPYEMREKIFKPFFRLKESDKQIGTGIGLALSRSLAELHKGLLVLNKSMDELNIFMLTLPVHQEKEFDLHNTSDDYELTDKNREESFDFMKPIILLVDDNPEILDFISDDLSDKYAIIKALNGQEALDMIEIENIQLIISDVMMPVMDGFELCKKIKTNFDYSHIPIILLTAKNTLQSKIEGLEVGADAYIEKPFSPEHLQVQIANLLTNRSKIKEHFASSPLANINTMAYSKPDESFLDKLNAAINKNIQNPDLDVEHIANLMNMSKPTLYRKVKAISNLTINELINITRLKAAAKLLEDGDYKIYEVANMVGYSSQSHLGRNFLKQFGTTPTEYQQNKRNLKTRSFE